MKLTTCFPKDREFSSEKALGCSYSFEFFTLTLQFRCISLKRVDPTNSVQLELESRALCGEFRYN